MTAPEQDSSTVEHPTVEEFRNFVQADASDDENLTADLAIAIETIDEFCAEPVKPIPPATRKRWYLLVAAELWDVSKGPSTSVDPFGNSRQTRSSRDPMHVIIRQVRRYVPAFR